MSKQSELFQRHTALFNQGVRSGDFGPMLEQFTDDSELLFEGIPVGPFRGKVAIAAAYAAQPPDDEIEVLEIDEQEEKIRGAYAWRTNPGKHAGEMIITPAGDKIAWLLVRYGLKGQDKAQ
jgi:hypothetical protein